MNPVRRAPCSHAVLLTVAAWLLGSCGTTAAEQSRPGAGGATATAEYPAELRGHWVPVDMACTTPMNYDSDVLVVIDRNNLGHYEDASKPVEVRKLSSDPHTWAIKSLLNIGGDGYDTPVSEVFALGGAMLVVVSKDGIKTYQKCD